MASETILAPGESVMDASLHSSLPSWAAADPDFRKRRIAYVESLRDSGTSDAARWRRPENHHESWTERGVALSRLIRPGESVFEFGAGRAQLGSLLPEGCRYVGSDAHPIVPGIVLLDINAAHLILPERFDVALFSGVFEYVCDLRRLTAMLASRFRCVVGSYAPYRGGDESELEARRYSGWFNDCTREEFEGNFERSGFRVRSSGAWAAQLLYRFERP